MRIAFDHTIASTLSTDQLWHLLVQSFRNSDESPIWPHGLESVRSAQVEAGALVRATYKTPGGLRSNVTYRFAEVEPGRRLRYETEPSHPLRGGGTVEVLAAPGRQPAALVWRLRRAVAAASAVCCGVYAAVFRGEVLCGAGEQFARAVGGYHNESLRDGSQWRTTNGEAEGGSYLGGCCFENARTSSGVRGACRTPRLVEEFSSIAVPAGRPGACFDNSSATEYTFIV